MFCATITRQVVANNMMALVYNDHVDDAQTDAIVVITFRVACAVPPLLCALLFRNFSEIVNYGGERRVMPNNIYNYPFNPVCTFYGNVYLLFV